MKMIKNIFALLGLIVVTCVSVNAVQDAPTDENLEQKVVNDYNVYALPIPEEMEFAGERVPLELPDIRERMDRELLVNTYWQSNGLLLFKRANKYLPTIERILEEEGVPDDFKYLAMAESALENNRSPAGAAGFWHFLTSTGKEYGLEINDNVDERFNLEKATRVAAQYLKNSYERFGSWTLAAAAYNAGNYGISKQQERQDVTNYYDLLLNDETSRYVFRILAFKEIISNPKKYGFNFRQKDLYGHVPVKYVKVDTAVADFAQFAQDFGINYKILKLHNPWLREKHLNNATRKVYTLEIPEAGYYSSMGQ
ncbi:lytic transglycosylase domain-containing protein [Croceiramulus getboli]|nr:lytic transglycosylase domain-containing protein [Flavobacteriaceae bacterium YJPT1-3]